MLSRRALLAAGLGTALLGCAPAPPAAGPPAPAPTGPVPGLPDVEREFGRRIGVHALDTGTGAAVGHRDGERFLMCSVVKALTAGFVLHRSVQDPGLLARPVRYDRSDLLEYAPVTEQHLATGLTVEQLCDAAVTVSDNTAQNLLLREAGSPAELTGWLRGLGDEVTRVDRLEPALNERDGDLDTSTPAALAATLGLLTTGDALPDAQRDRLLGWLRGNTTGDRQIRAGVPQGWQVGDKTGSGPLGERNDAGVLFPPQGAPVVLSVFTVPDDPDEEPDRGEAAVAAATRTTLAALRG
ncbi:MULTISPECIES: class A beta-lactamase [Pseudonocardia]|uniref:Beta-lactamase n=2 Tax=Pseudonocardia TaxID=1847 RepID=A0A1Y2MNV1_PSEAH|nr:MULTISPECIES: class A beta-lactamase [Pseudonocardia]OSY36924.1 Beta-lactamase precursor [Pseudonocardia autotrophica]TDN75607.1 beta-lactamase class A [Pseudonocardia autotrophica]BBF99578.1 beta-lactamase [Pseudonocardia autotrophica]GEC28597.1 beta-lactamase [Pseudonocardia saturnea]